MSGLGGRVGEWVGGWAEWSPCRCGCAVWYWQIVATVLDERDIAKRALRLCLCLCLCCELCLCAVTTASRPPFGHDAPGDNGQNQAQVKNTRCDLT